jgi:membrane protein DedA with SNARE-associated domain
MVPVALTVPPVNMLPPVMLPVVLTGPPAGSTTLPLKFAAVMLPVALIWPPVSTLPAVTLPVAETLLVDVISCESLMTVLPLILIAIFVLLYLYELGYRVSDRF